MSQQQSNPDDTNTDCYRNTEETNTYLVNELAAFDTYMTGNGFNAAVFADKAQVALMKFNKQMTSCSYIEFLMSLDAMLNNTPQFASAASNLGTQLVTGWSDQSTSVYLSVNRVQEAFADGYNGEKLGQGIQLFLSQLLKVQAGESDFDVVPTSAA